MTLRRRTARYVSVFLAPLLMLFTSYAQACALSCVVTTQVSSSHAMPGHGRLHGRLSAKACQCDVLGERRVSEEPQFLPGPAFQRPDGTPRFNSFIPPPPEPRPKGWVRSAST